jgi:glycosyltransferase involved in cell wall biosynthesis
VPYLLAPHGTAPRIERRIFAKWLFDHTVGRQVLPGAARLLAVTEAEKLQLAQLGVSDENIRVIPHPVDLSESREPVPRGQFRRRFAIPWEQIVLYLGKLTPRKGLDVLVEAFAKIKRASVGLVIAGNDMGVEGEVRRLVDSRGIGARTLFTGLLKGRERLEALADADVVTYPSQHEVFGLVPLEALLCGTPVIVSGDSGCGEVIGATGGGRVVAHGNPRLLADAIEGVLAEPAEWRAAAEVARERVRETYDNDAVFLRLDGLYLEMVRDRAMAAGGGAR